MSERIRITLVNPYVIYECPNCEVRVATESPNSVPDCPNCGLLGVSLEFVDLGEFISVESKAEIERLRREREVLADAVMEWQRYLERDVGTEIVHVRTLEAHGRALALITGEKGGGGE